MDIIKPRSDFIIVKDYFTPAQAAKWLEFILKKGEDPIRGFAHPNLKPTRFHKTPKYPVRHYMCMGLYWNPLDYSYQSVIPGHDVKPWPISASLRELSSTVLTQFFNWKDFCPETALINFYDSSSSMGLHVDKDEEDHESPVVGISFGSTCRFFFENEEGDITDIQIPGNSLYIFGRQARLMRHGVGTIYTKTLSPGSDAYLKNKERLSITIRQVYH